MAALHAARYSRNRKLSALAGSTPPSAFRTETSKDHFTVANYSLAERAQSWLGHVIPLHVFHIAAPVADEVMMPNTFRIEPRGATLNRNFTHQSGLN